MYQCSEGKRIIDTETMEEKWAVELVFEDIELELVELFPKQSDLRLWGVRLLLLLEESGLQRQTELM